MSDTAEWAGTSETTGRYCPLARLLRWVTAALVAAMFGLGVWMVYLPPQGGASGHILYNLHESLGLAIFGVVTLRFAVRLHVPPPKLGRHLPMVARAAAPVNHLLLYALLFAMPVIGYFAADAHGVRLVWFELLTLPSLHGKNDVEAQLLSRVHGWGALILLALILLHLAGAGYHTMIRRDGTLRRML